MARTWDPEQIRARCPDAQVEGIGLMTDYALCFPRRSVKRNCGVSSVTPCEGQNVWGVVYRLTDKDLAVLDANESFRSERAPELNSSNRVRVVVVVDDVPTEMLTYIAVPQENAPPPNAAYLKHIRDGALHHGLPASYLRYFDDIAYE